MDTTTKTTVYDQLETLVREEVGEDFVITAEPGRMDVDTQKPVVIAGRERDSLNLLSVIIQKHHVGFYFMPVYSSKELRANLPDELATMLKGKSCFHCKEPLTAEREAQLRQLIADGISYYKAQEWV